MPSVQRVDSTKVCVSSNRIGKPMVPHIRHRSTHAFIKEEIKIFPKWAVFFFIFSLFLSFSITHNAITVSSTLTNNSPYLTFNCDLNYQTLRFIWIWIFLRPSHLFLICYQKPCMHAQITTPKTKKICICELGLDVALNANTRAVLKVVNFDRLSL